MSISEITFVDEQLFKPQGRKLSNIKIEPESKEYLAHTFLLDGQKIIFRKAKITPTKTGQFVTVWKRNSEGITAPYDVSDDFEFFLIFVKIEELVGFFIFPKAVLLQKKIISDNGEGGKRGIRVYPPWDSPLSSQAMRTQKWQIMYFHNVKSS